MVRAVLDTNVIVSALFWGGWPRLALMMAIRGDYQLLTSEDLVAELLEKPKFLPQLRKLQQSVDGLMQPYINAAETVQPQSVPSESVRDPDDVDILACAVGGKADYLVSGDKDLLVLESYEGIDIITVEEFINLLKG